MKNIFIVHNYLPPSKTQQKYDMTRRSSHIIIYETEITQHLYGKISTFSITTTTNRNSDITTGERYIIILFIRQVHCRRAITILQV